jgi:hypothetical protein
VRAAVIATPGKTSIEVIPDPTPVGRKAIVRVGAVRVQSLPNGEEVSQ